jgi:hypothetical protein
LLVRLAQRNVCVFAGLEPTAADKLQRSVPHAAIMLDDPDSQVPLAQTYAGVVTFVLKDARIGPEVIERINLGLSTYIIGPEATTDTARPDWLLRDTAGAAISVDALLGSI